MTKYFYPDNDGLYKFDIEKLGVNGVVDIDHEEGTLVIYEFSSHYMGRGNARKVLKFFKKRFSNIVVIDIGEDSSDDSWKFWVKMKELGLVDVLLDSEDNEIT